MPFSELEVAWGQFVQSVAEVQPSAYVQIRKMVNGHQWEVPYSVFKTGINFEPQVLQYASWKSKFAQLDRNYLNPEEMEKLRVKFLGRMSKEQTCVTARFGNMEKKKDSMGFCMQTISMNLLRKPCAGTPKFVIEIYYRSTECVQKFLADLKYLHERILPLILKDVPIEPDCIRFRFCTMYLSSMFLPILFQILDPVTVVKGIQLGDPHWYKRTVGQALGRWLQDDNPYNWRTQKLQWDNFNENVKPNLTPQQLRSLKRLAKRGTNDVTD